jgi:hypothetical protein
MRRESIAVLARRRTAQRPARRAGAIRRPEFDCARVTGLLRDGARQNAMSVNAYELGRAMVWSKTAELYMDSFEVARPQRALASRKSVAARGFPYRPTESPRLSLGHRHQMTLE